MGLEKFRSGQTIRYSYTVNVTTSTYVQLDAALDTDVDELEIFDSSGQDMILGIGASGSEEILLRIPPGGLDRQEVNIPSGTRLSVKAGSATATAGVLIINTWKR